ncbi:uncharacterized protein LOC9635912 [Selaginella moellendorffii]|uniref:uncharacterized protein LOC9635912 n=1 Tax=Selaginella moellendorffii TaxID=88036 RepID=UPI000D1C3933|nr:uncharacterized protein LOC9635912 [Selaginella moellendorffii]|eukprot:XP_024542986.1 uncharacterized protein LOC9635912 [Selaginella moellendorffii]
MEAMFQRARHAMEIALEKSREQARELAMEASKRADQIKDLALDKVRASVAAASPPDASATRIDEEEYQRYGITPELRDFVQGLTIDTFRDFPMEDQEIDGHSGSNDEGFDVLSPWKEHHALLVLSAVPEISEFRYKLCPKHIKDKRFWRIYFTLVDGHLAKYNAPAQDPPRVESQSDGHHTPDTLALAPPATAPKELETPGKSIVDDEDLDNYLLGALDGDDDEHSDGDDGSLDAEFEQLVKDTAMDSDTEKL